MKVYKFKFAGKYGGGDAIVAANSDYEAYKLLVQSNSYHGEVFNVQNSRELTALTANVKAPTIISVEYYQE